MGDSAQQSAQSENSSGADQSQENAPVVDYADILARQNAQIGEQSKTVDSLRRQLGETGEVLGRVRKAFVPDEGQEPDPYAAKQTEYEQFMDYFLQQGLEAERKGSSIPLTVTLGTKLAQLGIESEKRAALLEKKLNKMEQSIARQESPDFKLTDHAASIMEGMLQDALGQVYGEDASTAQTRNMQFEAVARRIGAEIKDLQKTEPETWDKIRRNPKYMRNMVNHFTQELLPPKARQMMEHQQIMDTPMTSQELWTAFNEAKAGAVAATSQAEADHYSMLMDNIRQDIIAEQYGGRKQGRQSLNQLMKG